MWTNVTGKKSFSRFINLQRTAQSATLQCRSRRWVENTDHAAEPRSVLDA